MPFTGSAENEINEIRIAFISFISCFGDHRNELNDVSEIRISFI